MAARVIAKNFSVSTRTDSFDSSNKRGSRISLRLPARKSRGGGQPHALLTPEEGWPSPHSFRELLVVGATLEP